MEKTKVSDALRQLLLGRLSKSSVLVWYDPEHSYEQQLQTLVPQNTKVIFYSDSFIRTRHEAEPWLVYEKNNLAQNLIVYVPIERSKTQSALIELESFGIVLEPGANSASNNTRLKVIAERVFKKVAPAKVAEISAQIDAGKLSLEELDRLCEQTAYLGAIPLIFNTASPESVLLMFISSPVFDEKIEEKDALGDLAELAHNILNLNLTNQSRRAVELRHELRRRLLLSDFALSLGDKCDQLRVLVGLSVDEGNEQLLAFCSHWRNRLDLAGSYAEAASAVSNEFQQVLDGVPARDLANGDTFLLNVAASFAVIEEALLLQQFDGLQNRISDLKRSFWVNFEPELTLKLSVLELAMEVMTQSKRVSAELRTCKTRVAEMVSAYVGAHKVQPSAEGWEILDRKQRHLEHRYAKVDPSLHDPDSRLERLIRLARFQYAEAITKAADKFAEALISEDFEPEEVFCQSETFWEKVHPRLTDGKVAYFLVDALRYEMAVELVEGLQDEFHIEITPALAQLPTFTEVGMACLMPGAEKGMELVDAKGGKVGIRLGSTLLKDRNSRIKYFEHTAGRTVESLKLNDLSKPSKQKIEAIKTAELILVTSQEIDRRGEEIETENEARIFMDHVLDKLRRSLRTLGKLGVEHFVISADHGYLFVDEVDESMKVQPPGGDQVDLHERVWIGTGGRAADAFIRVTASALGLGGSLELAFPKGIACFKTPGRTKTYFHGGISLQEAVVPIVQLKYTPLVVKGKSKAICNIVFSRPYVSTRIFSLELTYSDSSVFHQGSRRIKVNGVSGKDLVAVPAAAIYGFEEGAKEVLMEPGKPNRLTMMLTNTGISTLRIQVNDAVSGAQLHLSDELPVKISI